MLRRIFLAVLLGVVASAAIVARSGTSDAAVSFTNPVAAAP